MTDSQFPPRGPIEEDARETLAMLHGPEQMIQLELVAQTDGVELEIRADGALRRQMRFLRDTEARKYADRLSGKLQSRGFKRGHDAR